MVIRETEAKTILSKSRVFDYAVNPYTGCVHRCLYCYARFMRRFTGRREAWGTFVDVKINAAEVLARELTKKKKGHVWVSGVCDPYQYIEKRYLLTRRCLDLLVKNRWPVTIQTKSPLVLRDLDILKAADEIEVGLTITTLDERIRGIFEPGAPAIAKRVEALSVLHREGIKTFVMVAPLLPHAEGLPEVLKGIVDYALIDRYNYHYADWAYRKYKLEWALCEEFFLDAGGRLESAFEQAGIQAKRLY